jgi:hypothetical protein
MGDKLKTPKKVDKQKFEQVLSRFDQHAADPQQGTVWWQTRVLTHKKSALRPVRKTILDFMTLSRHLQLP